MAKLSQKLIKTAYHEAGHAVAAVHTKRELKRVTIDGDGDILGSTIFKYLDGPRDTQDWFAYFDREGLISYSGPAAEFFFSKRWSFAGGCDDYNWIWSLAESFTDNSTRIRKLYSDHFKKLAMGFVEMPAVWFQIGAVANELLIKKTLSGNEVIKLCRPTPKLPCLSGSYEIWLSNRGSFTPNPIIPRVELQDDAYYYNTIWRPTFLNRNSTLNGCRLSSADICRLSEYLMHTHRDVLKVCESWFEGFTIGIEIYWRLRREYDTIQCQECSRWCPIKYPTCRKCHLEQQAG